MLRRKLIEMLFQLPRQEVGDGEGNLGVSVGGDAAVRCLYGREPRGGEGTKTEPRLCSTCREQSLRVEARDSTRGKERS